MTSVINRVRNSVSRGAAASMSPAGRRERKTSVSHGRVIPPEPVQQQPDGELTSAEADPAVTAHNLARANKMVPKLQWDDRLAHDAQTYAKTLASTGKLEHSGNEVQGENLFVTERGDAKFEDAVLEWMRGETQYSGEKIGEGSSEEYEYFCECMKRIRFCSCPLTFFPTAQCLWHSTTHVGMGKAKSLDGRTYIVARYSPPGNIAGEKPF